MPMSSSYDAQVSRLIDFLEPLVPDWALRPAHWISTPDGDLGSEWCEDCGTYMVRHLRRHDRKRREDYILDGGWSTDAEHFTFCSQCGKRLHISLTQFGAVSEIENYEQNGFSLSRDDDAYELSQILASLSWREATERDTITAARQSAIELVSRFLEENTKI